MWSARMEDRGKHARFANLPKLTNSYFPNLSGFAFGARAWARKAHKETDSSAIKAGPGLKLGWLGGSEWSVSRSWKGGRTGWHGRDPRQG